MDPNATPPEPPEKSANSAGKAQPAGSNGNGQKASAWALVARYSAIGMIIPSHLFAGWLIGTLLNRVFSTTHLDIIFVLVGVVSGFIEMIRVVSRDTN